MPIDFIKLPADKGLPILNIGSHPILQAWPAIYRAIRAVKGDELVIHPDQQDQFKNLLTLNNLKLTGGGDKYEEGKVLKMGIQVARVIGIPLSKSLVDRITAARLAPEE